MTPPIADLIECDVCRQELSVGAPFHRLLLALDETPSYAGLPPEAESTVESTHEVLVCAGCEPRVTSLFDGLLEALWALRVSDEQVKERERARSARCAGTGSSDHAG